MANQLPFTIARGASENNSARSTADRPGDPDDLLFLNRFPAEIAIVIVEQMDVVTISALERASRAARGLVRRLPASRRPSLQVQHRPEPTGSRAEVATASERMIAENVTQALEIVGRPPRGVVNFAPTNRTLQVSTLQQSYRAAGTDMVALANFCRNQILDSRQQRRWPNISHGIFGCLGFLDDARAPTYVQDLERRPRLFLAEVVILAWSVAEMPWLFAPKQGQKRYCISCTMETAPMASLLKEDLQKDPFDLLRSVLTCHRWPRCIEICLDLDERYNLHMRTFWFAMQEVLYLRPPSFGLEISRLYWKAQRDQLAVDAAER